MLAGLPLRANREVPIDTLIGWVCGGEPPDPGRGRAALHTQVARLRRVLGHPGCVHTTVGGYLVEASTDTLDLLTAQELADRGYTAAECGDRAAAAEAYDQALSLFRGVPLSNVESAALDTDECSRCTIGTPTSAGSGPTQRSRPGSTTK